MRMKKNTRDYGKVDPPPERNIDRAGESDVEMRGYDGMGPWLSKQDPYSGDEERDAPSDTGDNNRKWPDDIPANPRDKDVDA